MMEISDSVLRMAAAALVLGPLALMAFVMIIHMWLASIAMVVYCLLLPFGIKKAESFGDFMDDYI